MIPDYFISLVMQYSGALNSDQAERYTRSVIKAWYLSIDQNSQKKLVQLLPGYLKPQVGLFYNIIKPKVSENQEKVFVVRVQTDLAKTSQEEAIQIIKGIMKSLKVISSQQHKFAYSSLFGSKKLQNIFIES